MQMKIELNDDQAAAMDQILAAYDAGETRHVLTGNAGTGKTTLVQMLVEAFKKKKVSVCVTAPTHKAVSVLTSKLRDAELHSVETMTIHSLLGLKPKQNEEDTVLIRSLLCQAKLFRAVVIGESSTVSSALYD